MFDWKRNMGGFFATFGFCARARRTNDLLGRRGAAWNKETSRKWCRCLFLSFSRFISLHFRSVSCSFSALFALLPSISFISLDLGPNLIKSISAPRRCPINIWPIIIFSCVVIPVTYAYPVTASYLIYWLV